MTVLQIEHKVPDFDGWKKAFEADPIDRKKSGVKSYRIYRPANDDKYVVIDLVFDNPSAVESVLASLRKLWNKVEGTVMMNPHTRILTIIETKEYL